MVPALLTASTATLLPSCGTRRMPSLLGVTTVLTRSTRTAAFAGAGLAPLSAAARLATPPSRRCMSTLAVAGEVRLATVEVGAA